MQRQYQHLVAAFLEGADLLRVRSLVFTSADLNKQTKEFMEDKGQENKVVKTTHLTRNK